MLTIPFEPAFVTNRKPTFWLIFVKTAPGLDYDYTKIDDFSDEWAEIEERVGDELEYRGLNDDYFPNEIGTMCESILDIIP